MNATAEHTDLNYIAGITPEWGPERFTFVEPDYWNEKGSLEFKTLNSSSAFPFNIDRWFDAIEPLHHVQTESGETAEPHVGEIRIPRPHIVVARSGDAIRLNEYRFIRQDTLSSVATDIVVLVDFGDTKGATGTEHDAEYQEVIEDLQKGGREILADELIEMLRNAQEDAEELDIKLFSLQAMARFLIRQKQYDDPIFGPDPHGLVQIEWHIDGDGLLVMAFLEEEQIHCVVQADATPKREMLNKSVLLTENQAVEEFGYLVPLR